jgi:hypothetical protein
LAEGVTVAADLAFLANFLIVGIELEIILELQEPLEEFWMLSPE